MARTIKLRGLIDRTGSMAAWHKPVVAGINAYLEKVKDDPNGKDADSTIVIFDSMGFDVIRKGRAADIAPLKDEEFVPRAATPLFDCVGSALTENVDEGPDVQNVLFVLTDGLENYSKKYTIETIRALIIEKQKKGWVIIYLGANVDAWKVAGEMGIPPENTMNVHVQGKNAQPAPGVVNRMIGNKSNPIALALVAAAGLGLAYALFRSSSAHATPLGFTDKDRNDAMGVNGVDKTWEQARDEDIAAFDEPITGMFDLPNDLQQQVANLPADFDPALGSMAPDGTQAGGFATDGEILSPEDVPSIVTASEPETPAFEPERVLETAGAESTATPSFMQQPADNDRVAPTQVADTGNDRDDDSDTDSGDSDSGDSGGD